MSKVQTNNSWLQDKINLRLSMLPEKDNINILECFRGSGEIWNGIKKQTGKSIKVLGIDKLNYGGGYLKGDNIKFMQSMNLSKFDIVDLDAYGIPFKQLEILFNRAYKGIIFVTFIQSMFGNINNALLAQLGYTSEMINKIPSLFNHNGIEKFKNYLFLNGIKEISIISIEKKHYLGFVIN